MSETSIVLKPYFCPCGCACDFLSKFDKNVYDIESTDTFLYQFFEVVCTEFCDIYTEKMKARNDVYLYKENVNEVVIKGVSEGKDCFSCKSVVEIISVGNSPGASDYIQDTDYIIDECGISWVAPQPYYYHSYSPRDPIEPETGARYYVTYRCGVRNSKLYDTFGVLVDLVKKDSQSYPDYRRAIKALILAYILGPTIAGMKEALSPFISTVNIYIEESYKVGWVLGESWLYEKTDYENPAIYTGDGTILQTGGENFVIDVWVYNSYLVEDQTLFTDIVNKIKPAHAIAYVHFL